MQRPSATAPHRTVTSTKTTPIAAAIRDEVKMLLDVEVISLILLSDIVEVARSGRELVAVRNPIARFDAKAQGVTGSGPGLMTGGAVFNGGFVCDEDDLEDCANPYVIPAWGNPLPTWKGRGPTVRGAQERLEKDIQAMLKNSPLAKAAKAEILQLTETEPFGPGELLQIEQLASHTHRLLSARLGLPVKTSRANRLRRFGGPEPFSSSETYGAKVVRELGSALSPKKEVDDPEKLVLAIAQARNSGMPDLAAKLEMKLTGSPPPQAGSASAQPKPIPSAGETE